MQLELLNDQGQATSKYEAPETVFGRAYNEDLGHQVVVAFQANARQGTRAQKDREQVKHSTKKPFKQKGTGRSRQGSVRAPEHRGGGVVHGPVPRDYSQRTPKKMIAAALRGALSDRARDGQIFIVSEIVSGEVPSTKAAIASLTKVAGDLSKVLVVIDRFEDVAWLSLRNDPTVHAIAVDQLNTYDVLVNDKVVFTSAALAAFVAGPASGKSAKAVATESEAAAEAEEAAVAEKSKEEDK